MPTSISTKRPSLCKLRRFDRAETGATLIEMAIAMLILMIGLLSLVAAVGWGLRTSQQLRNMSSTKMTVTSMLEQMETLRNTRRLTFGQLANEGTVDNTGAPQNFNGFAAGFQPVSVNPGPDGIYGTTDDLVDAGSDNLYGTGDDYVNVSTGAQVTGASDRHHITERQPEAGRGDDELSGAGRIRSGEVHNRSQLFEQ